MVLEVTTFRLASGVEDATFLALDRRWQTELVPNRSGFVRRTTARRDGAWVVVTLWSREEDAAAFDAESATSEVRRAFEDCLEAGSLQTTRVDTLD